MSGDVPGPADGFVVPPMPPRPPGPPPAPPVAPDALRALAVALLNLTGLGLGYALLRRWVWAAACWAATAVLLVVALPADPDGVPAGVLAGYAVVLGAAAAHGAVAGLRSRLSWPGSAPVAALLGLVLLAVPTGGGVLYGNARDEATEQMLLDRLQHADDLVKARANQPFATAQPGFRDALGVYADLGHRHPGSRAAHRLPDRMAVYYRTVAAAYAQQKYCEAITPLEFLRTVPQSMREQDLGTLATWPDSRLADALYGCGANELSGGQTGWTGHFGELLTTFSGSAQAAEAEPAVKSAVDKAAKDVGGDDPCAAVSRLSGLGAQIRTVASTAPALAAALDKDADRADRGAASGTYPCGVHQYRDGSFDSALTSMNKFVRDHPHDANRARAQKIAIAAEIAQTVPAAGKKLPTTDSGGSIQVTIKNDSPDDIEVLYTGPVTGSVTVRACGSCSAYSFGATLALGGFHPCGDSGKDYPQRTISLPPGTTYFLHKPRGGSTASPASDTAELRPGYVYTECAYTKKGPGALS
ncbi:hypothetical protein [Streptomyces sp. SAT1]|uniref:hypothetical protein n=1 Tax=Streptomyces sp. SAT1 TaxID=1849967 RepID=UPI000A7E15A2|nr:hypothetical protein [Streptomyces sp. SAT1]